MSGSEDDSIRLSSYIEDDKGVQIVKEYLHTYNDQEDFTVEERTSKEKLKSLIKEYDNLKTSLDIDNNDYRVHFDREAEYLSDDVVNSMAQLIEKISDNDIGFYYSGIFWCKPNDYCGWHTNSDSPGERIYFVWAEEDNKSFFRYKDTDTGEIITKWEKKGWQINRFKIPIEDEKLFWHCVGSYTNRFSIGFNQPDRFHGIHFAGIDDKYGDWRISDNDLYLNLKDIEHLLKKEKLKNININDIAWKGRYLSKSKKGKNCICCGGKRYINSKIEIPGVLIKNLPKQYNKYNKKYRMIDGKHRIEKIKYNNIYNSKFYVLEFDEIKKYFKFISK